MVAVEKKIGKILRDDDEMFRLAFQQDKEILRYASERLRKTNIQSQIYQNHSFFEQFQSHISSFLFSKCLKLIKSKIFSLRVSVSIKMSCNPPTVSVMHQLSTILKTSLSLGSL